MEANADTLALRKRFLPLLARLAISLALTLGALPVNQCFAQAFSSADSGIELSADKMAEIHDKAYLGDAGAQCSLGFAYSGGIFVNEDAVEGAKWYRKAAEQGNAYAQLAFGEKLWMGTGVAKDDVEAVKWFFKAAEKGHARAQHRLGMSLLEGMGVAKNEVAAAKWLRKASEQGEPYSQSNLGIMFRDITGVTKDDVEAVKWFLKAAERTRTDTASGRLIYASDNFEPLSASPLLN